jgi:hypothetical protein
MRRSEAYPQRYFKVEGFGDPRVLEIRAVVMEPFTNKDKVTDKPVLYFKGVQTGLVLSLTNWDRLGEQIGNDETDMWTGATVKLWLDRDAKYNNVPCPQLRLDLVKLPAQTVLDFGDFGTPPNDGVPLTTQLPDDGIPF